VDDDTDRDRDKEKGRETDIYRDRDRDKDRDRDRDISCRDIYRHSRHSVPSPLNIHTPAKQNVGKGRNFLDFSFFFPSGY
jgi:hypothetical protein